MPKRSLRDTLRVAVCAESDDEAKRLTSYVASRGWQYVDRDYRLANWTRLVKDAQERRFNAVCASIDGLWWFAQVAPAPPVENTPSPDRAATKTFEEVAPDGSRIIHTHVMSTSGVPVDIAIPLKPMTPQLREELAALLAAALIKDLREHPAAPADNAPPVGPPPATPEKPARRRTRRPR